MTNLRIKCPHCERTFADQSAVYQHSKVKHNRMKRAPKCSGSEDDESFADRTIQASIDQACGVYNFDQGWLLP